MDLQKRVKCWERENRWMKRIGVVVVLLCGIVASLGFQAAQDLTPQMKELQQAIQLAQEGRRLTAEEAQKLEDQLKVTPKDLSLRTQLLGYYESRAFRSEDARKARCSHVLWVIENYPGAAIAGQPQARLYPQIEKENYQKAKALWLKQVDKHKDRARVFGNAASFFQISDQELAESLLSKARNLEPNNSQWAQQLGQLYKTQAGVGIQSKHFRISPEKRKELSAKALKQFEDALNAMKTEIESEDALKAEMAEIGRSSLLQYVAVVALDAGELKKAEAYATEMLTKAQATSRKRSFPDGNLIHHGNLVLGRLALASGDLAKAKQHLIEAGKTPGSPQLNSFGPNMTLAKELLEKGEKEIVLEYFQLCSKFWKRDLLEQWADVVEEGQVPNFGETYSIDSVVGHGFRLTTELREPDDAIA